MPVTLSPLAGAGQQFFDNNGNPLTGGKLYTYSAGTTTPLAAYTTNSGAIAHTNPIILDSAGRVPSGGEIWLTLGFGYKFVLTTSADVVIATYDNIPSSAQPPAANDADSIQYEQGYTVIAGGFTVGQTYRILTVGNTDFTLIGASANTVGVHFIATGVGTGTGTAEYSRTVELRLRDTTDLADFGAVGDGVANDRAAVAAAIASQKPLRWIGTSGNTFRITTQIAQTVTKDVIWYGDGATIVYDGAHAEYALRFTDTAGVQFLINDITIDGSKLCNKVLEVLNNTSLTTASEFIANNLYVKEAKRLNTFNGGDGILIRGAFNQVVFNNGGVSDCELPAGQGISGTIGISGITVTWYSTTSYARRMVLNGTSIEKIYSSDLTYEADQDGIKYFVPDASGGGNKVESEFICTGGARFLNCYGRSIKTQCRNTIVENSYFERTEGFLSGIGNVEAEAQTGSIIIRSCVFSYKNGQEPGVCVGCSTDTQYIRPGLTAKDCEVYLDSATTLSVFALNFPRSGFFSRHQITGIKIFGKVVKLFDFLCNGDKNFAEVSNCYANEIVNGETGEKALVYVRTSGTTTPRNAIVTAFGNVYDNTDLPAIVRDNVGSTAMNSTLSAWNNQGFANDLTADSIASGLKTNQVARLGRITGDLGRTAYFDVISKNIGIGATETFSISNASGCLVFIQARYNSTGYALIGSTATVNTVISKGTPFEVGNTTEPATGIFRVWSSGTREISIKNTDTFIRTVSVFVMSP
jgi:hypothetical protein